MQRYEGENSEVRRAGLEFVRALAEERYENAYEMLASSLRDDFQPRDLQVQYREMTSYWSAPADPVTDADAHLLDSEWPDKEANDIGWVQVSIRSRNPQGGVDLEGVCVRVACVSSQNVIAQIEWGRP